VEILEIWMTQRKLRRSQQIPNMVQTVRNGESLLPIILARSSDGSIRVENGHHRIVAIWLSGRRRLSDSDYVLVESDEWRPRFGTIEDMLARNERRLADR
jgi:hypothetical protein